MPKLTKRPPKYCKYSDRDQGYFYWKGKRFILSGKYNSKESLLAYHTETAKLLEARASESEHILELQNSGMNQYTVADIVAMKLADAKNYGSSPKPG